MMKDFVFDHIKGELNAKLIKLIKPVGEAFPSYLGEEWLNNLTHISNGNEENSFVKEYKSKGTEDKRAVFNIISEKIIQLLSNIKTDHSALLIIATTLDTYSRFLSYAAWTKEIQEYLPKSIKYIGDPITLQVNLLESYFDTNNLNEKNFLKTTDVIKTDTLVFWYIARAILINKDLIDVLINRSGDLKSYFSILIDNNAEQDLADSNNLFLDYLISRNNNNNSPLSGIGGYDINIARKSIFYYQRQITNSIESSNAENIEKVLLVEKVHNIVVLGESRSGKTTIIKELKHASEFGNDVEPNFALDKFYDSENKNEVIDYWSIERNLPPETVSKTVALQGNFQSFNEDVNLYLHDHNGALFMDDDPRRVSIDNAEKNELEKLCQSCNQLIIAIPPYLIDNDSRIDNVLTRLFHYARVAILSNKNIVISIAYTMCDDYGCIIEGPRRVIHDTKGAELFHIFKYATGKAKNVAWENFINHSTASNEKNRQWQEVRRHLLQKTKELWRKIAHSTGENHFNINGYYISAMHPGQKQDRKEYNKRGLLEIISDYLQYMSPPRNFNIVTSINENPRNREVTLTWEHNGPHLKEYRIYTALGKENLLQKGAEVINLNDIYRSSFRDTYSNPLGILQVEYDPETNLPKLDLYNFTNKNVQLNTNLYFQVLAIDKFNYLAFSDIIKIKVNGRKDNPYDWFLSQNKHIRILIVIAVLLTVVFLITIIAVMIKS